VWAWVAAHAVVYAFCLTAVVPLAARAVGRVPMPCFATKTQPIGPLNIGTCLLARNYVVPSARDASVRAARQVAETSPGTVVRYLDAGFPLGLVPMLPHLSHDDGRRIDFAFLHTDASGEPVDGARWFLGYWGYVPSNSTRCADSGWRSVRIRGRTVRYHLRWDMDWLQLWVLDRPLDGERSRSMLKTFAADPGVRSILLEPSLHRAIGAPNKMRANGCSVARHDDHFHVTFHTGRMVSTAQFMAPVPPP